MNTSESVIHQSPPHHLRTIESVAEQRHIKHMRFVIIDRLFFALEYMAYLLTFYSLLAIKVLPEYPYSSRLNPIDWIRQFPLVSHYALFLLIFIVIHLIASMQRRLFNSRAERSNIEQYMLRVSSILYSFLITIGITFLLKTTFIYSRVTLVAFVLIILVESILLLSTKQYFVHKAYKKGIVKSRVLIIGAGRIGNKIRNYLIREDDNKVDVVGFLDDHKKGRDILGVIADLEEIIQKRRIDTVYITIPSERYIIESMLRTVYKYDVDIRIIPEMYDRMPTVFKFRSDLQFPCLQIVKTPLRGINVALKRIFDIIGSISMLFLLSPLVLCLAVGIKLDSHGPVFYRQQRIGKNGRPFQMLKFRSMRIDAEREQIAVHLMNEVSGPAFKIRQDPRVTRLGAKLRKYSMDELPQLWNVLKGEMSLIGPRPPLPQEVEQYTDYHWRRLDVLPGMTGLWQVSGRSDLKFEDWIGLDIYYIERWSFTLEMKILIKTIPAVLKGTGAY